MKYHSVLAMS